MAKQLTSRENVKPLLASGFRSVSPSAVTLSNTHISRCVNFRGYLMISDMKDAR